MKKKLSIIVLALVLIFSIVGCGSKADTTTDIDTANLTSYADTIVSSFGQMSDGDFEYYEEMSDLELNLMLLQTGLPVESENFLSMIEAWKAGVTECGEFIEYGEFTTETTSSGVSVSTEAKYANKSADIILTFDEEFNIDSMTVNAHYSTGEILEKAGLNTILGMGTVFVVLIFISFIISLFRFIPELEKKFKKSNTAEVPKAAPAVTPKAVPAPAAEEDDTELAAVIAAAIAAAEGTSADGFIVRSIKRRKSNKWI